MSVYFRRTLQRPHPSPHFGNQLFQQSVVGYAPETMLPIPFSSPMLYRVFLQH